MKVKPMKLTLELIPDTASLHSLHRYLTEKAWKALRTNVLEECDFQCAICESKQGQLNCHEQWEYDDETETQKLVRLVMLCQMCHLPKHMNSYHVPFEELVQHFLKVNGCSRQEFDEYYQICLEEKTKRGTCQDGGHLPTWEQDFGDYTALVSQKGNLKQRFR